LKRDHLIRAVEVAYSSLDKRTNNVRISIWLKPGDAQEYALVCDDPDAPTPKPWVHWVVYGIPAEVNSLPEGDASDYSQGTNTAGEQGYTGPMPPEGHGTHHYHFTVYALDEELDFEAGLSKEQLLSALKGHILAEGELVGTYER
jgi:hypothetical protein